MAKLAGRPRGQDEEAARAAFWDWFRANCSRLAEVRTGLEPVYAQLVEKVSRVHKALRCEFSVPPDGLSELIVSADGDREVFPAVERLVAAAPDIPGWKVTAFRQRRSLEDVHIRIEDQDVKPDDIWYATTPCEPALGLEVYVRGLKDSNEEILGRAAFLYLDFTLGEYDATTKVAVLKLQGLPPSPEEMGLRPLAELPAEVDSFFR